MPARTATIGYAIGRAWWGRGVATEAARAAIAWAIPAFGLDRSRARCGRRESVRVADHAGGAVDEVVYGLVVKR